MRIGYRAGERRERLIRWNEFGTALFLERYRSITLVLVELSKLWKPSASTSRVTFAA